MEENNEIIEIGEPDLPEITITDADEGHEPSQGNTSVSSKYGSESLANAYVSMLSLGSSFMTKRTGIDMDMTEAEAQELHEAAKNFGESLGGVDLPPWLVLILATGTFAGTRYASYVMSKENVIEGETHG